MNRVHAVKGLPVVVVHTTEQAALALAAARAVALPLPLVLLSAPGAAGTLGPAWFLGMVAAAAAADPFPHWPALDCADAPGQALAALRSGCRLVVLAPEPPGHAAVAAAAAELEARVWPGRPPAFDLGRCDLRHPGLRPALEAWLRDAAG
jgi:hypothetical protein